MSRSYKKHPWFKNNRPEYKKLANRKVRNGKVEQDIPDGGTYKKYGVSWNIYEQRHYQPFDSWRIRAIENICTDMYTGLYGHYLIEKYWRKWYRLK